jgi:hypothetical protein
LSEVSFTSAAFSPKMARRRRSSGASSVSDFGSDLADEDVAGLHLRADADDAVGSEVLEGFLAEVGDVPGDFLGAELGVAGAHLELVDVDAGEDVVLDDAFADQDGVLEVVAVPGHERDEHVAAEGEFAFGGAGAVGDDLALADVTLGDQGFLVDAGGGIRPHEFADVGRRRRRRRGRA